MCGLQLSLESNSPLQQLSHSLRVITQAGQNHFTVRSVDSQADVGGTTAGWRQESTQSDNIQSEADLLILNGTRLLVH